MLDYYECRDVEELDDFLNSISERKAGELRQSLSRDVLGKRYETLVKLCLKVEHFNIGFYCRFELASMLGVISANLNKLLNKYVSAGLIRYTGDLPRKSTVRIVWNPSLVWKGVPSKIKQEAIRDWSGDSYLFNGTESGIYFIRCGEFIKIGCSSDIRQRFLNIQSGNPYELVLEAKHICCGKTMRSLEKYLHNKFKDSKHMLEWFRADFSIEDFNKACEEFYEK